MDRRQVSDGSRRRLWLLLAVITVVLTAVAAGCGGGGGESTPAEETPPADTAAPAETEAPAAEEGDGGASTPIKVAILSDCEGAFGAFYEPDIGGALTAFVKYAGATPNSTKPSDGVTGATVAGRPIEFVGYGCSDDTADKAIEETKRLMEQLGADIMIGPLSGDEGIAVANYAKEHPDKTFLNGTSGAQDTTLKVQAPNFFRFNTDGAQWSAGLGDYAYNELGWRKAAVFGDDYSFPYTSLAGFVAEFCAAGGEVVGRVWPPLGETDYSSWVQQLPTDVDGVYWGIGGSGLLPAIKAWEQARGELKGEENMGNVFWGDPLLLKEFGEKLEGAVTAGPTAAGLTPAAQEYEALIDSTFPDIAGTAPSVFTYNYFNAAWALIKGLEAVGGDISDGQMALQQALATVELEAAYGTVTLDGNRNAIADNFVAEVVPDFTGDGISDYKTIRQIPGVEQTFGGTFSADTPAPDRENPTCEKRDIPWIGAYVEVGG